MRTSKELEYPYIWPKFLLNLLSRIEEWIKYFDKKGLNNLKETFVKIYELCESVSKIDGDLDLNYEEYRGKGDTKFIQRMKPMINQVKENTTLIDTLVNNLKIRIPKEKTLSKEEKTKIIEGIDIFKRDLDKIKALFKRKDELIIQEIKARATK